MKVTLEGKSEEIQEILSFMHMKQENYLTLRPSEVNDNHILKR